MAEHRRRPTGALHARGRDSTVLWVGNDRASKEPGPRPVERSIEPRPLSDDAFAASEPQESRLELVPALDDPEEQTEDAPAEAAEAAQDEDEDDSPAAEELEALESAVRAQDPLKLYVRSIDGGPLLTRAESRSSPAARTRATTRPSRS
jgi:hypothetical protein